LAAPDQPPATGAAATVAVAVVGPTASGKSALGLALAARLDGEILCCDSMQVYRGMDIGTAKATAEERRRVPHHLLDLVSPAEPFHAAAWAARAQAAMAEVTARGRLPLVVGGTGLYFRALTRGLFDAPPADPAIRARHQAEAARVGVPALHQRLAALDPDAAAGILPGDLVRVSRALEVLEQTGQTITALRRAAAPPRALQVHTVVLDPPLAALRTQVEARVAAMMAAGFLDEVRALRGAGFGATRPLQAIGYRQLGSHLDGETTLAEAVREIASATVAYARRQRTWFRREPTTLRLTDRPDADAVAEAMATSVRGP
jgi:tRNA dimethylallyltransferase